MFQHSHYAHDGVHAAPRSFGTIVKSPKPPRLFYERPARINGIKRQLIEPALPFTARRQWYREDGRAAGETVNDKEAWAWRWAWG